MPWAATQRWVQLQLPHAHLITPQYSQGNLVEWFTEKRSIISQQFTKLVDQNRRQDLSVFLTNPCGILYFPQ